MVGYCIFICSVSLPVVSLEKMPCFNRPEGTHIKVNSASPSAGSSLAFSSSSSSPSSASLKSSLTPPASHKNQEKLLNGRGPVTPRATTPPSLIDGRPSPSRSPMEKRPAPSPSSQERKPPVSTSPSLLDRRLLAPPSPPERKHQNGAKGARHRRVSGGWETICLNETFREAHSFHASTTNISCIFSVWKVLSVTD